MADTVKEKSSGLDLAVYGSETCPRCNDGRAINDKKTGERVRERRTGIGVSQDEMARGMGISPTYLSDLELGKRFWDKDLLELAAEVLARAE